MAIIKAINSKASIGGVIDYITDIKKAKSEYVSGINCSPNTAIDEMKATKKIWNKTDGRQYKHFIYSFNPKDRITPELAHQLAQKLMDYDFFKGYEIVIATHTDTKHIHNHIVVNSVNAENGKKFNMSDSQLEDMKSRCVELSRQYGLMQESKNQEITTNNMKKYKAIEKAVEGNYKSYVLDIAKEVSRVKNIAISKKDFIKKLEDRGIKTNWKDNRKYITFTDKDGNKVRNSNLQKTFKKDFSKEKMLQKFKENNREKYNNRASAIIQNMETEKEKIRIEDIAMSAKEQLEVSEDMVIGALEIVNGNDEHQQNNNSNLRGSSWDMER